MEQAPYERKIIEECIRRKRPLPPKIENAPRLELHQALYYEAFLALHTCRGGMGDGPIPWTAMNEYALTYKLDDEQRETLFYHVRALDQAWMEWQSEKRKRESPPKPPRTSR